MAKIFSTVLFLAVALAFLSGCGKIGLGSNPVKTTTTTRTDPATQETVTTVTEEPVEEKDTGSFFKSENLTEHYDFEGQRSADHAANVDKKVSAITANTAQMMALPNVSDTEKLLTGVIANMQIDRIPTTPGPSGVPVPKTGVDVLDHQAGNLLNFGLGVWDRIDDSRRSSDDDTAVSISNTGDGNVVFQSDRTSLVQQTTKYKLGDSTGEVSFAAPSQDSPLETNDSHDVINTQDGTQGSSNGSGSAVLPTVTDNHGSTAQVE